MAQVITPYDPIFYAQAGIELLEKALGMAGRVYRGYDKNPQQKGSTIQISKPSTFSAQDAPSTAQELQTESLTIQLNYWREVKFALTDKELSYTQEKIIQDHVRPAVYALADDIDQKLALLYKDIPWYQTATNPIAVNDLTGARSVLFNNKVPMNDLHGMVDGTTEEQMLRQSAFTQWQGAGQVGVESQLRGAIGTRYGIDWFANQNVQSHTSGTSTDAVGAVNNAGGYAAGIKVMNVNGLDASGTVKIGDTFAITGHTQRYVVTADATASTGAITGLAFEPGLEAAVVNTQVVTFFLGGASKVQNLVFHRNAFALAMAPLPTIGDGIGARIESIVDPKSGLAVRSRVFYVGDTSKVYVAMDVLYGVKTLNRNMAVRLNLP
jgi:hypothetical protein